MDHFYGARSLAVCRSGAITVAELDRRGRAVGAGAVARRRRATTRRDNARVMERAGAAVLVPDAQADGATWMRWLASCSLDPDRLDLDVRRGPRARPVRDAAERLADLVEETARARA